MELTDLTKEQREKLNSKLMPLLASEKIDQEIFDFILQEHPKLVYITMEKLLEYTRFCNEESERELAAKREELATLQADYAFKKQIISEKFKLTLDEVEEINERFKFKRWAVLPVAFRIIVLYWKLKRIFRGVVNI
ncbi:hypothetical protein P7D26_03840 [Lactococcus petauri]|uniref:hypothetical protein n=1 Tax=Lactococcus petauri TaxID=1940789 RepID=UPI00288E4F05|nr:hypothetical protein [Lactococcus petauri]MDT2551767.1 hypothetical protein [Lactococcus petauri]MDT2581211.1 hypothetical protein [Lactococcus petauri]MDT2594375.1 hypothetical protein [Lactococcus petauri]